MPADLRLNPDVENARAVAATGDSVVYFARLAGGGYCAELVTRGAVCSTSDGADRTGMSVTVPFTDPVTDDSPVTVSGRVARPHDPIELDTVSTESDLTLVLRVRGSLHVEGSTTSRCDIRTERACGSSCAATASTTRCRRAGRAT